eukprot:TRINITY_DN15818_c0_g1_i1.p1 TRINITY_DN15818_c0_g1~~TRINITY_DN15818_c0_g1_i1.p1  ORF type:complete len:334 (-),score=85.56 TRINITY_DN15818_c0_g1_i1:46-1047(-)
MSANRFLITGGGGFIGAWIVRSLLKRGAVVASLDNARNDRIVNQILTSSEAGQMKRYNGDVADLAAVKSATKDFKPTHVIHLAGVQVPICRADPIKGALINVTGTLNVFESVKEVGGVKKVVCASSAAAVGLQEDYKGPVKDNDRHAPRTHYGVFKSANEGNARIYWQDNGIASALLRPHTVYGVGREFGMTSGPTKAIKAAILGQRYELQFNGITNFNYVKDLAELFIGCAFAKRDGAPAFNIGGTVMSAKEFLKVVEDCVPEARGLLSMTPKESPLPIAYQFDQSGLQSYLKEQMPGGVKCTAVKDAVVEIAEHFRDLKKRGILDDADLKV